jgi:hypothetical protein
VVALPSLAGIPRAEITVAHYTAPALRAPGAPRRLAIRLDRKTYAAAASWHRVAGAAQYEITVRDRDGRRLSLITPKTKLAIPAVFPGDRLDVSVQAQADDLLIGKPARAHLTVPARRHRR